MEMRATVVVVTAFFLLFDLTVCVLSQVTEGFSSYK